MIRATRALVILAFTVAAVSATAQQTDTLDTPAETSRFGLVLQAIGFGPVGEFRDNASFSLGGTIGGRYFVDQRGLVALYGGFGRAEYGRESWSLFGFDVTTTTTMFFVEVGPQIHIGRGPVVPYIHGTVGFARIATVSSVDFLGEDLSRETDASDNNLALAGGGGFRIRIGRIFLDLTVTYQRNGTMTYLVDDEFFSSRADVLRFHAGVSINTSFFANRKGAEQ